MYQKKNILRCHRVFTYLEKVENVDVLFFSFFFLFLKIFSKKMFSKFEKTYFHSYFMFSLKMKS